MSRDTLLEGTQASSRTASETPPPPASRGAAGRRRAAPEPAPAKGDEQTSPLRVLVLAPHPFFQLRGTPIDVDILLRALSLRGGVEVDALVYPEGEERTYPSVRLLRTPAPRLLGGVRPGFSLKKLGIDALMLKQAWALAATGRYDVVHAGEEAVFIAQLLKRRFGIPYVYDLDSSIAQQLVEKLGALRPFSRLFARLEAGAIRGALATAPVCNALADLCRGCGARKVVTLHDISQLEAPGAPPSGRLGREAGTDRRVLLYVGNLEPYQGIDLLIDSFALAAKRTAELDLVIIGGVPADIARYRGKAERLGLSGRAHFLGPRPFEQLDGYLTDADILVAPRIRGVNTPMKVFPYLHSGRPVLVTDLPTHSQLLTPDVACLAPAEPGPFAEAIVRLAGDRELCERLGQSGRAFVERNHTFPAHQRRVDALYDWVAAEVRGSAPA